ncbi:DsbA family protein [Brevirhabdus sp.]|uniref:DsbA family protein n=1 Tax=Brevirhabdus sp. TaxID=2004514 RepID=UPI004057DF99
MRRILATTALMIGMTLPVAASAQQMDKEAVKQIITETLQANPSLVLDAITSNPEVVMQAITILREREAQAEKLSSQAALASAQQDLFSDDNAPVGGNPDGKLVIVEFFDYNCPYCKRAMPVVKKAIEANPELKVIYREWPILSEGSVVAARASLAAQNQEKYDAFHEQLMQIKGQANETSVMKVAREVGLDIDKLKKDMQSDRVESHIATSMQLAQSLNINGTPTFVIGDQLIPGFIQYDQFQKLLDDAPENG